MLETTDLLGKPFVDGGRGPNEFDCYGLAMEIWRRAGIELPDYKIGCADSTSINQAVDEERYKWIRCEGEPPVPAMVVIRFNQIVLCNHVGVYLGGGRFIHTRQRVGVCIERIDSPIWRKRIEGYYVPGWCDYGQN